MAASVNKVILIGHAGKDPDIKTMQSGSRLANLSVATSVSWKDKATGERKENTQWHRLVIFNDAVVDIVEKYVKKGSKLYIEGQLETRKWTGDDGKDNYATEVVLRPYNGTLKLLDSRKTDGQAETKNNVDDHPPSDYAQDLDDDIPF